MYVRLHAMPCLMVTEYKTVEIYKCTPRKSATTAARDIESVLHAVLNNKEVWSRRTQVLSYLMVSPLNGSTRVYVGYMQCDYVLTHIHERPPTLPKIHSLAYEGLDYQS